MPAEVLVDVALTPPIPGRGCLTYAVPVSLLDRARPGARVRVPLGRASRTGLIVGHAGGEPPASVKPIQECLDEEPFLDRQVLDLCTWAATYYMAPVADVIATFVPSRLPRPSRALRTVRLVRRLDPAGEERLRHRSPRQWAVYQAAQRGEGGAVAPGTLRTIPGWQAAARRLAALRVVEDVPADGHGDGAPGSDPALPPVPPLSPEQDEAARAVVADAGAGRFRVFLLFGITGSGKTNVYLAAARAVVERGRSVLILTPEIGLAHETAARARQALGDRVVLLHSALAPRERWGAWARARRGRAVVAVGPRSALFVPLADLGLVVVDEEHDAAYKQEEGVRYHARDLAVVRARIARCPIVLASATPSVESFHHARSGRYTLLELRERPQGRRLPDVSLLDTRTDRATDDTPAWCSPGLQEAIRATARRGEQALLFLNRRGFAHFVQCPTCGEPVRCTACSVTLTLHAARRALVCHHCGFARAADHRCVRCGGAVTHGRAPGTEQIEDVLARVFPDLRVARMDRDSTGRRGAQARLLRAWHAGDIDVLVGTQMVAKGIDNPRVTLVGVLNADISLNQPDFRAAERTFQLVSQVAGRAGRGDAPGHVVVQTLRPDHYSLQAAATHDYPALFAAEIASRRALGYPPFRRFINVRVEARDATNAERIARDFAAALRRPGRVDAGDSEVLGPAPAPIERLRGWYRWQILVRGTSSAAMRRAVASGLDRIAGARGTRHARIVVDVDPCRML
jgi:primosomal protein N' (replication factor Y)